MFNRVLTQLNESKIAFEDHVNRLEKNKESVSKHKAELEVEISDMKRFISEIEKAIEKLECSGENESIGSKLTFNGKAIGNRVTEQIHKALRKNGNM